MTLIACDPLADRSMYERVEGQKILIKEIINLRKKLFTDSEDSDEEGGLGNVNRLIIRPAGHSGKAKKGKN